MVKYGQSDDCGEVDGRSGAPCEHSERPRRMWWARPRQRIQWQHLRGQWRVLRGNAVIFPVELCVRGPNITNRTRQGWRLELWQSRG